MADDESMNRQGLRFRSTHSATFWPADLERLTPIQRANALARGWWLDGGDVVTRDGRRLTLSSGELDQIRRGEWQPPIASRKAPRLDPVDDPPW